MQRDCRRWDLKFGPDCAQRQAPSYHDIHHMDEVVVMISAGKHGLRQALDRDGHLLDEIVQTRRDPEAAKHILRRLLLEQS